jgi:hypothetical protein
LPLPGRNNFAFFHRAIIAGDAVAHRTVTQGDEPGFACPYWRAPRVEIMQKLLNGFFGFAHVRMPLSALCSFQVLPGVDPFLPRLAAPVTLYATEFPHAALDESLLQGILNCSADTNTSDLGLIFCITRQIKRKCDGFFNLFVHLRQMMLSLSFKRTG